LEVAARIIVSGLIILPEDGEKFRKHFMPTVAAHCLPTHIEPMLKVKAQAPFLRHTLNRIDLVAVCCFWIDFFLMVAAIRNIYVFKALSVLRTLRLVDMAFESWTPLRSLKESIPLLRNVSFSASFLFVIFRCVYRFGYKRYIPSAN
jgi:hypothetical protein